MGSFLFSPFFLELRFHHFLYLSIFQINKPFSMSLRQTLLEGIVKNGFWSKRYPGIYRALSQNARIFRFLSMGFGWIGIALCITY